MWYSPAYRLPITGLQASVGLEPRRADYVAWWLLESRAVPRASLRTPHRVAYEELDRVHTLELLESLGRPETLARIFAVDPSDVPVDELMETVRLSVGGTVEAAREALRRRGPTLNLQGGFHHAGPGSAGGFCPVNDVAVALAALRKVGFGGRVVVLDLDAHPPDGIAACLARDPSAWIGSLSGSDWGPLPRGRRDGPARGNRRRALPVGALGLARADAAAGPRLRAGRGGRARRRPLRAARPDARRRAPPRRRGRAGARGDALGVAAGGRLQPRRVAGAGRHRHGARRALARPDPGLRTTRSAAGSAASSPSSPRSSWARPTSAPPISRRRSGWTATAPVSGSSSGTTPRPVWSTPSTATACCSTCGGSATPPSGWRSTATGRASGSGCSGSREGIEHLLIELVLERRRIQGADMLYVHWMSLRHPRAQFSPVRPRLPGQEVPGLGLARELGELLAAMARRLDLGGVVFRPAHFHTAFAARRHFAFVDAGRQGRFEALVRDLAPLPLLAATEAVSEGRVLLGGAPYAWEADEMAFWPNRPAEEGRAEEIARERERCQFTVRER